MSRSAPFLWPIITGPHRQLPQYILLVGGFGESPYLQKQLTEKFGRQGVAVVTIEEPAFVAFSLRHNLF
jgi:alpha-beta hydrolase superfamily lysophospholipase